MKEKINKNYIISFMENLGFKVEMLETFNPCEPRFKLFIYGEMGVSKVIRESTYTKLFQELKKWLLEKIIEEQNQSDEILEMLEAELLNGMANNMPLERVQKLKICITELAVKNIEGHKVITKMQKAINN